MMQISLLAQGPFVCKGEFYLSQSLGLQNGPSFLFRVDIDPISGQISFNRFPATNNHGINAVGYRLTDNYIYGVHPSALELYRIGNDGSSILLTNLDHSTDASFFAGDVTPDGKYLVLLGGIQTRDTEILLVDLEDSLYSTQLIIPTSQSTGGVPMTRIADIAFDPTSGILYGFDFNSNRMVTIDLATGVINDNLFPASSTADIIAAFFFDAFGNLYAFGSEDQNGEENSFYRVDKESGSITFLVRGPAAQGADGCSCPYTISLQKSVFPDRTVPCTEITYTFIVANASGSSQQGILFEDPLPGGFSVIEVLRNPYGGLISGLGTSNLRIEDMHIPLGIDSIIVKVDVGEAAPGTYFNQASLSNLPSSIGGIRLSDNPLTFVLEDSTPITVDPLSLNFIQDTQHLCLGENILIDASLHGVNFRWHDGSTSPTFEITREGIYQVLATSGCDSVLKTITVFEDNVDVTGSKSYEIKLGEQLILSPEVINTGDELFYSWSDPQNTLSCTECPNPLAQPLFDSRYDFLVENEFGCQDTSSIFVFVDKERLIYVPNVFSPNGDGVNDRFFIQGIGFAEIVSFRIYNRWGGIVFEREGGTINMPDQGWDGTSKGKMLEPGVYVWKTDIRFLDGIIESFAGDVTLMR